jgi:hypothetical protein
METKTKLGQGQYFTQLEQSGNPEVWNSYNGITIRQKLGSDVLCALLSNPNNNKGIYYESDRQSIVLKALSITDTFLKLESE